MRKLIRSTTAVAVLFVSSAAALLAQTGAATVQGSVKDPSGALVPRVRISLTHQQTGRTFQTASNSAGLYVFPAVQPGDYTLRAESPGMETWQGRFVLPVGQTATVDVALKLASTASQVTVVVDAAPLITDANGTIANVVERERIDQLPLNGRFFANLVVATTEGVEPGAGYGNDKPRVFGMRFGAMEFTQDGATLTNRDVGTSIGRPPGIDTIGEFRVETNNSNARLSRPATAMLSTRSGTNQAHGAMFETARNNAIGLARSRQQYYAKPPHLVRNEFGFSMGGPVYIPKLYDGRNRTFIFGAWEAFHIEQAAVTSTTMATAEMRQGDFTNLIAGNGRRYTVYDPWTTDKDWQRIPYPNNVIPIAKMSPIAKYLYSVTPEANFPNNPLVAANYYGLSPTNRHEHTETFRVDHRLSAADQIFGRFSYGHRLQRARRDASSNGSPITLDNTANIETWMFENISGSFSWTRIISPRFFSETVFAASTEDNEISLPSTIGQENLAAKLGFPNPWNYPGLPDFRDTGFGMWYQGMRWRNPITHVFTLDQNFTHTRGRHEFQFGGRFRHENLNILTDHETTQGLHSFLSYATSLYDPRSAATGGVLAYTGHDTANMFLGAMGSLSTRLAHEWYYLRGREYALYFQDNWKVSPRLTLNLGLRWEIIPSIKERDNQLTGFDLKSLTIVNGTSLERMYELGSTNAAIVKTFTNAGARFAAAKDIGYPERFIHNNWRDLYPRIGFAYRAFSGRATTVIRGGYSMFGFPIPLRSFDVRMGRNAPYTATISYNPQSAAQSPDGLPNYGLRSIPQIIGGVSSKNYLDPNGPQAISVGGFTTYYFNPDQPTSKSHQMNLTLERPLWRDTVFRGSYTGTFGFDLDQYYNHNPNPNDYTWLMNNRTPLPTGTTSGIARRRYPYGDLAEFRKTGSSSYHGFTLGAQRRFAKGYAFQIFYVLANAYGNATEQENNEYSFNNPEYFYVNGTVSSDEARRDRQLNYRRDPSIPKHRVRGNYVVDLPFGRGKLVARNAGGILDRIIGGWQLAGMGTMRSNYIALPITNWGPTDKVEVYGKKYPIQDCRSGVCYDGYLWYNGYIPANRINSTDAQGRPNGVMGVPKEYKPSNQPINTSNDTNLVDIRLQNGSTVRIAVNDPIHPFRNLVTLGPKTIQMDASLFKRIRINERWNLRFNADFFNVMNNPGLPQPAADTGVLITRNSANGPRALQLTLRLLW
jgi:hypothetical protein